VSVEEGARSALEAAIGHHFTDENLLETALTHASFAHETGAGRGNERLEFLGDAVLDLVVGQLLYEAHPDWPEGELTRSRAALVNRNALADCGRKLALGEFVKLGRTEQRSAGEQKASILADCFEAVVGALYLDGGLEPVAALARRLFGSVIEHGAGRDPKTEFQEWAHARFRRTPTYSTTADSEAENDEQRFTVEVCVGQEVWGTGVGRSKRVAEQDAARAALERGRRADDQTDEWSDG
jgi:ribonuclease-3